MALTPSQSEALDHLRAAFLGPEQGEAEVLFNRPSLQYSVGMLFPSEEPATLNSRNPNPLDSTEHLEADVEAGDLEESGAATTLAEDWRPSSTAISFVTQSESVLCDFKAATYVPIIDDGPL